MKKVLICGLKKDRKGTLELLQRQGVLEISNVLQEDDMFGRMDVTSSKTVFERNANIAEQAINILDRYAPEEKGMLSSFEGREVLSLDEYEANAGKHDEVMKKAYRLQELAKQIGEHSAAVPKHCKCVQGADMSFHCLRENGCGSSGRRSEENEFCKTAPELSSACETPAAAGRRACKGKGGD